MRPFITGSHAYGKPSKKSDVNLVMVVDETTREMLIRLSDDRREPVRYGRLNLIILTTDEEAAAWKVGTEQLALRQGLRKKGTNKWEAAKLLDILLEAVGFSPRLDQSSPQPVDLEDIEHHPNNWSE